MNLWNLDKSPYLFFRKNISIPHYSVIIVTENNGPKKMYVAFLFAVWITVVIKTSLLSSQANPVGRVSQNDNTPSSLIYGVGG